MLAGRGTRLRLVCLVLVLDLVFFLSLVPDVRKREGKQPSLEGLPLTLMPVVGYRRLGRDQAADTPAKIRAMVEQYVSNKNTVILAVEGANTDLQTSETLQVARSFDPHGARTLCVLTKVDLLDRSDTTSLLRTMARLPLGMGYSAVRLPAAVIWLAPAPHLSRCAVLASTAPLMFTLFFFFFFFVFFFSFFVMS